ncbi:hypothetical protein Golax_014946, partial [Gossypium laxum]|nr:hypothetical protein [Gossypium laxum]
NSQFYRSISIAFSRSFHLEFYLYLSTKVSVEVLQTSKTR